MNLKSIPIADPIRELKKIKNFNKSFINELNKGRFVGGENVIRLEEKLKNKFSVRYVVTTNSGTDSLILSVAELNLKRGDEVLVPSFTFFATVEALIHFGLKPVFVDIDRFNFTVDEQSFYDNVNKKTKAFLPVHIFGKTSSANQFLNIVKKIILRLLKIVQ